MLLTAKYQYLIYTMLQCIKLDYSNSIETIVFTPSTTYYLVSWNSEAELKNTLKTYQM